MGVCWGFVVAFVGAAALPSGRDIPNALAACHGLKRASFSTSSSDRY
jgi:hypothetical protein